MEVGGRRGRGGAEEEDLPLLFHRGERRPWLDQVLPDVGGGS